jgi:hypothetical protein
VRRLPPNNPAAVIGNIIKFIFLFIASYSALGVSLWAAYILGTEVLQLSQRHAILLALLPILWIQMAKDAMKRN